MLSSHPTPWRNDSHKNQQRLRNPLEPNHIAPKLLPLVMREQHPITATTITTTTTDINSGPMDQVHGHTSTDSTRYHHHPSYDDDHHHYPFHSSQPEPSQTQMTNEILTQTAEWTQMGDEDDDNDLIPSASQCESMVPNSPRHRPPPPPPQPWGRLMPCSSTGQITQLFPRSPLYKYNTNHHHHTSSSSSQGAGMVSLGEHPTAFLRTVQPCDIFNVHFIGRSAKCDIPVKNPSILSIGSRSHMTQTTATSTTTTMDKKIMARQEWCYGMISNRHCKIYCTVDALALTNADVQDHDTDEVIAHKLSSSLQVWVEDCSGNGTIINGTTVLMKGDKRLLHSGDEICLVQQPTLQKKVVSRTELQHLLHEYSFVFVNCVTNHHVSSTPRLPTNTIPLLLPPPPLSHATTTNDMMVPKNDHYGSRTKRKPAVDVRATKSTRIRPSLEPLPPLTILSDHGMINDRTSKRRTSLSHDYFGDNTNLSQPPTTTTTPSNTRRISPRRQQPRRVQEDYDIRDVLGSGTMGEVRRAIHRRTGQAVAIKVIPIKRTKNGHNTATNKKNDSKNTMMISTTTTMEIEMEALILQKLQHPYIVKLMDVYMCPTAVYLVMELVQGGDLFDRIIQKGNYTEIDTRRVMRRLLAAVHYLHESSGYGIVHRDLKPENILLTSHASDIDVKLTDFGLAKQDGDLKTFCGTPQYFAPEVLRRRHTVKGNGRYGKQADMWSLGVILYVLLTGSPPFDSDDNHPQAMLSSQSNGGDGDPMPLYFPSHISVTAQDMVRQLLQYDPKKRASIVSACVHEWILQDDGDTHIHPLDDPKLQTDGSVHGTVSIPITQKVTAPPIPDVPITTALEKTFALDASPTTDVSKTADSTRKIATSAENFSFKKDLCDHHSRHRSSVMDHGSPPRTPLLPVIMTKTPIVPPPPDCHNATTFSKTTLHHVPTNHITPATELNNFSNVNVAPSDNVTSEDTAIHLTTNQRRVHANVDNDDDIMSRFSENTESVGSFSTANTYSEIAVKQIDTDQTNQTSINAVEIKSKSLLSKKKRSLSNVSPSSRKNFTSGKTVKQSNRHRMDASVKTRSSVVKKTKTTRFRTNPIIASPSLSLPPSHVPVVQDDTTIPGKKITTNGDGRKQLTLNNWFKKHN